jgi:hypothetical protein
MPIYQHAQIGSTMILILVVVAVGLIALSAFFSRLTITIEDGFLRASFGPGLTVKNVPLSEIASCEPIRIRWWYGWGIHLTPYGWLYNVAGWDAVAITLRDGRKFALGTDDPQGLSAAIRGRPDAVTAP